FTFENFPSVAMYPGLLDFRRCSWHNDVGGNVQHLRGARQCLGVVATGMRSYSASARRVRKLQDSIGCASCLKRTNLLQVLAFEKDLDSRKLIKFIGSKNGRAQNVRFDAFVCLEYRLCGDEVIHLAKIVSVLFLTLTWIEKNSGIRGKIARSPA